MGKKQGRSYHSLTGKSSLNALLYSVSVFIIYCIYHGTYTYSVVPSFICLSSSLFYVKSNCCYKITHKRAEEMKQTPDIEFVPFVSV